ncbi:MAG: SusC/RagA family TonB-linked outer membrane protein [Flavobacterium sp.]|nr:SusC/RagA family TonB-linked outer membrane protein [Pedobacter sp.]
MKKVFTCKVTQPLLLLFTFLLIPWCASAQQKIKGRVIDKTDKIGLPGVTIREKGSTNGTTTDIEGRFVIQVKNANPVLQFSYIGYKSREIEIKNLSRSDQQVEVSMEVDVSAMNEVVVIGYQNIERKKVTGAVSSVKGKEFENTPYATFDAMLQGRVPGLTVLSTSGEPGANNIVNIRGSSSLDLNGSSSPLYVIDGIAYDVSDKQSTYSNSSPLAAINPNDIESIDVLKDASAAAIYGARAANGVIIVKTKRPKSGAPQIRISSYVGVASQPALKPVIIGSEERRLKMDLINQSGAFYDQINQGLLSPFLTDSLNTAYNNNTDWQGLFLQDGLLSNVDVSIAASKEEYGYRFSLNRYSEEGVMKGYSNSRVTPRLFLQVNPSKSLQVTANVFYSMNKYKHGSGDFSRYPFTTSSFPSSFWQIRDEEKQIYSGQYDELRDDHKLNELYANVQAVLILSKPLTITSSLSYNNGVDRRDYFKPAVLNAGRNDAYYFENQNNRLEVENYLSYTQSVKNHNFNGILGQGVEMNTRNSSYLLGRGIAATSIKTIRGVSGANLEGNTTVEERRRLSLFARFNYDYKGKYLLQTNFRRDGSSRYGAESQYANFPSVSAGWNIAEESFFESIKKVVTSFKIRSSYGITGYDPGEYYAQYQSLFSDASFNFARLSDGSIPAQNDPTLQNMTTYNGAAVFYPNYYQPAASGNISWVTSPQFNAGIDMSLFNNRISITADYYIRDSKDLVFEIPVPLTTGYTLSSNNYVSVRNTGVEFDINTNNLSPKFKLQWSTNFNIAINDNYVTKLPNGGRSVTFGPPYLQNILTVGEPLFAFNVWDVRGVYARDEDVPVNPLTGRRLGQYNSNTPFSAGDPIRRDLNGDYVIDDNDRIAAGSPYPKFTGGFNNNFSYKNFSLGILFTFIKGRNLMNGYLSDKLNGSSRQQYDAWGRLSGPASDFGGLNFWRQSGDVAQYPALVSKSDPNNFVDRFYAGQSLFVEDASFLRLKNIRLGYTLPTSFTNRLKIQSIRLYGVLDNLYVWSNATVPDPEAVQVSGYSSGNDYPNPKKYTFGLDFTF